MSNQENKLRVFLVTGLFLSLCLDILSNNITLPLWIDAMAPFLITAFIALLILVEAIQAYTPHDPKDRRSFLKHSLLSASTIGLLAIFGIFLIVEEADLKKGQQALDAQRKGLLTQLRIGLLPAGNNSGQTVDIHPFKDYLSNQLEIPVNVVPTGATYDDTVNALGAEKIDIAWLGPLSYLYAHEKYGAKVILSQLTDQGHKTYKSYIITNKNTNITTLQDPRLRHRKFALVDVLSTSGNLVPRYELKQAGIDPDSDLTCVYRASHEKVLDDVRNGNYLAGAVSSDAYDAYVAKGSYQNNFVILKQSMDIPQGAIALRKDIQLYDTLRIEDALFSIEENDPAILNTMGIGGFAKATDKTYQSLLDIINSMHIDFSNYNG